MKTKEEWDNELGSGNPSPQRQSDYEQIQLDAFKAGMLHAAEIVHKDGTVYIFKMLNDALEERKAHILEAVKQLTEKDLICQQK